MTHDQQQPRFGVPGRKDNKRKRRQRGRTATRQRRLRLEALEDRRLLALDAQLVADINALPNTAGSGPTQFVEVGSFVYFLAGTALSGAELWKSDGTAGETVLVKDINLGSGSAGPQSLTNVNGTLFFQANDGTHGRELWKSDGTAANTILVQDIAPGSGYADPADLTNVNGALFFRANDGVTGYELWKSDGTAAGTVLVKDIVAGSLGGAPQQLAHVAGTLFFRANDGTHGDELWKSDGADVGTVMVRDINAGSGSANPEYLTNVNGRMFFSANDGTHGHELWKSDGTAAGTVLVKDILDGGEAAYPGGLTNVNSELFFGANDGTHGWELGKSDGTAADTVLFKDINPGSDSGSGGRLTNVNGTWFFGANDGTRGIELWKSDGTAAGTVLVKDIRSGSGSAYPGLRTNVNGTLFFRADDGFYGDELWKSDGTAAGTVLVKDIYYGWFGSVSHLTNVNGTLFFSALDNFQGLELWTSDGTSEGTAMVEDINPGSGWGYPHSLTNINATLFFLANDGAHGYELWKSDGTAAGTVLVEDIRAGSGSGLATSASPYFTNVNGVLFFSVNDGINGYELWKSDGTAGGTVLVKDINPGTDWASPALLTNVNGTLFFRANDGISGDELWQSDGTAAGTAMVEDIAASGGSNPAWLTNIQGTLFFRATDEAHGTELWRLNDDPTDIQLTAVSIAENQPAGAVVGSFSTADLNLPNDSHTYALVAGTGGVDNGSFTIVGSQLRTAASFDFETKSSYSIRVRTTDVGGLWYEESFAIAVTDVNLAATDISLWYTGVAESQPVGTVVGTFSSVDGEAPAGPFAYALVSGLGSADNGSFTIVGNQLQTADVFDFETRSSYSIRVRTADVGGLWYEEPMAVYVTDLLDPPRRYDFNGANGYTSGGFVGVRTSDTFTTARGYGWLAAPLAFERSGPDALRRDGHYGSGSTGNTFQIAVTPGKAYDVKVYVCDTFATRDSLEVTVDGAPAYVLTLAAGVSDSRTTVAPASATADSRLTVRIRDLGGSNPYWVINGVEVSERPGTLGVTGASGLLPPDGTTEDSFAVSGTTAGSLYTVSTTLGTVTSSDVDSGRSGIQVFATGSSVTFTVRRPATEGTAVISAAEINGVASGSLTRAYSSSAPTYPTKFDFNGTSNDTATGFTGVRASDTYTLARGYGWTTAPLAFERSGPNSLQRDGHYGSGSTGNTFQMAVDPTKQYDVKVYVGDSYAHNPRLDNIQVTVEGATAYAVTSLAAGVFDSRTTSAPLSASANGLLTVTIRDGGGSNAYWVINGIELTEVTPMIPLTITSPPGTLIADGTTEDTFTVGNATAGLLYTVATTAGTITSPDAAPGWPGTQILSAGSSFTFLVRRPATAGTATITALEVNGTASGSLTQTYQSSGPPAVQRFDFNGTSNDTAAGFTGVRISDTYTTARGFGWTTAPLAFERPGPTSLRRDGHYGSGSTGNTFTVAVNSTKQYNVRVYVGDSYAHPAPLDNIQVTVEGATAYAITSLVAGSFDTRTMAAGATAASDGLLTVTVKDVGGANPYWVINGIDIWETTAGDPGVQALRAAVVRQASQPDSVSLERLTYPALATAVEQAVGIWAGTGLHPAEVALLRSTPVAIANLDAQGYLGLTTPERILIDDDGVGLGWDIPSGSQLSALNSRLSYDLLTTVLHEMGHMLGQDHDAANDLMNELLQPGERHIPDLDVVFAGW